ncbi:MAG: ATP-binding cassette domain-containing protein [Gammaproteobacteria bacterium]|nr:MAG: ATP-binding cassette domain-containing protein [Gammaproteobacteria bacterium]
MQRSPFALLIQRPMAVSMFFLALALLGLYAWYRIPVELLPAISGEQLYVQFQRPGSDPDTVEREILMPLEARAGELAGLEETWGEVNGDRGSMQMQFERGSDHKTRELELRQIAAELNRTQPEGTFINVSSQDLSALSRFVMIVQVMGDHDENVLRDLVDEQIQPRVAALPGISQVWVNGGAPREVTIWIDPDRCAALGVRAEQVTEALGRSVRRLRYLGGAKDHSRRVEVILDGRPRGLAALGEIRLIPERPVLLRHVAEIEMGTARQESVFRVNGKTAVGLLVFQDEGANLVQLGRAMRTRIEELQREYAPFGIDFRIGFDAASTVEEQLDRLKSLALSGFVIALVVLYLFLREARAVVVVAVAVPVSLLIAGAILYLSGYTLNLVTLLGLAIGIGMLVDNSIVVFEAIQRSLERGLHPDAAAISGIQRTIRAIIAATVTNAVVFLPAVYLVDTNFLRQMLILLAVSILVPLFASLLVAAGMVPLLAQRLAAPAALARMRQTDERRRFYGGKLPPRRARELFSAMLKVALRRPAPWLTAVTVSILLTIVIALPWVLVGTLTQEAEEAEEVRLQLELNEGGSLEAASVVFDRVEHAIADLKGIETVETSYQETGGTLTVQFADAGEVADAATAGKVRAEVRKALEGLDGVRLSAVGIEGGGGGGGDSGGGGAQGGGLFGDSASLISISGPDMTQLSQLAGEIHDRLKSMPEINDVQISGRAGQEELRIRALPGALAAHRMYPEDALRALNVFRREGVALQVGFTLADGRELPLSLRRPQLLNVNSLQTIADLRLATPEGALPLGVVTDGRKVPPPPLINHHNGRRELTVSYTLGTSAPRIGPARVQLEERIRETVRNTYRAPGYTIEAPALTEENDWFKQAFIPVLLLLYAVLAITFESLTMPVLVLVAVPLTVLGATWALVFADVGAGVYAMVGAIALLGITVNPAIILVDRMQRRIKRGRCSGGTAAITAVRERTRPVLMTSCTAIAGLWPLALSTGGEFEIWPPFATVVIGGLATSTLLTLLVIPVGFVALARLDSIFGRLGPWIMLGWIGATLAIMTPLIVTEQINSFGWQIATTVLVAGLLLGLAVRYFHRPPELRPTTVMDIETRYLSKVYGLPGPVGRAWRAGVEFSRRFPVRSRREVFELLTTYGVLLAVTVWLAGNLQTLIWQLAFGFVGAAFFSRSFIELRNLLWPDAGVRVHKIFSDTIVKRLSPWLVLALFVAVHTVLPMQNEATPRLTVTGVALLTLLIAFLQLGRHSAVEQAAQHASSSDQPGRFGKWWRRLCQILFGWDQIKPQVEALNSVSFKAEPGMIGILGPNGAGKTTLLRMLASVLDSTQGTISYGGIPKRKAGLFISRWIGYLPQDFGLPDHLTAREYLDYYALLYQVGNRDERRQRVDQLLQEVGLGERMNERISGYSGGMRQRVAVARTLLRQPPIIIVDEPTVGLDPRERIRFRNLLSKLAVGRVVLFSTHVVEDVAVSCSRVIVFNKGRIRYDGSPGDLARLAVGKIWELRVATGADPGLTGECKVVDQAPEADGGVRLRIMAAAQPHAEAIPAEPGIEEGYLQLVT